MAARERRDLERKRHANDRIVEQRPSAGRMREHERALQLGQTLGIDVRPRQRPEAGVHAVNHAALGDHARDRRCRGVYAPMRRRFEPDALGRLPDAAKLLER